MLGLLALWVEGYFFSLSIISFLAEAIGKNRSLEMMMSVTTQDPTPESVWALVGFPTNRRGFSANRQGFPTAGRD